MSQSSDQHSIDRLLDRDMATVIDWERRAFDEAAGDTTGPGERRLVLFGAGGLGRKVLAGLRELGIEPLAFADNNPKLAHQKINGLTVLPVAQAAQQYGASAVFVVTIWGGYSTERMGQRIAQLKSLGCQTVVSFGPLFWKYPRVFLPHYSSDLPHKVFEQADDVKRALGLWADQASRDEYLSQVRWRTELDFDSLADPVKHETYFPDDLVSLRDDEKFVDCGAFDGDTLAAFVRRRGEKFGAYAAFEPDPANFQKLSANVAALPESLRRKISVRKSAVGAKNETVYFGAIGTEASSVGTGTLEVESVALDAELQDFRASYIKMDIEGSEPEALAGAKGIIERESPVLAICSYHKQDHLWRIPLLIASMSDSYRFFLRPHLREVWDLVCYAVPKSRLLSTASP